MTLEQALTARRSCREFARTALTEADICALLWAAQGITDATGKRTVPSAHGLQSLSIQLIAGRIAGIASGVYAVGNAVADDFGLRLAQPHDLRARLADAAYDEQPWMTQAAAIICLCADMKTAASAFSEQAPYGMRGYKYAHIEAGAMAQNIALQATARGLGAVLVAGFRDDAVKTSLALPAQLSPLVLMCIGHPE